jgi:dolichol-phosphate mannosyltransferase
MYKSRTVILIIPALNEEAKIGEVIRRTPRNIVDKILVIDDGSTDRTSAVATELGADVISLGRARGVGYAIRRGLAEARRARIDIVVTIAGNNKDAPEEITRLLDPICEEDYDFVIGSRYLAGGGYGGDMPFYRKLATRLHPALVSLYCRKRLTETTNGYRALKVSVLADLRIDLDQPWLDGYQLEVYLLIRLLKLGYRSIEVPVTKVYPSRLIGNTKMRPIVDWWHMLSPILIIGMGMETVFAALARTHTPLSPK